MEQKTQKFKQKKEDTYGDANNLNILYFLSYSGFILNYGEKNILDGKSTSIDDTSISIKYPPTISFVKYTGETFSDGIISQVIHFQPLKFLMIKIFYQYN